MIFVIIWLFVHFTFKPVPSVNGIWVMTSVNHLHIWITKFKPSFMFFKLSILTSNNVIWVNFSTILFDETQHVAKTSTVGYVPVCYEIINLFIEPQNFMFMFFICKLKGFYLIVTACDGFLMLFLDLFNSCIKSTWYDIFQDVLPKCFTLAFLRFCNDIHDPKDWEEFILLVSMILRPRPARCSMGGRGVVFMPFQVGISHLSRLLTDVSINLRP